MTNAERTLFLALIDNLISQAQALRGAICVVGRDETQSVRTEKTPLGNETVSDEEFEKRYKAMLAGMEKGNDDGDANA